MLINVVYQTFKSEKLTNTMFLMFIRLSCTQSILNLKFFNKTHSFKSNFRKVVFSFYTFFLSFIIWFSLPTHTTHVNYVAAAYKFQSQINRTYSVDKKKISNAFPLLYLIDQWSMVFDQSK